MAKSNVLVVLHDVAPPTWADYRPFVESVDALGNVPMTLLVVPDFHHRHPLMAYPELLRVLDRRLAKGDELALHGYCHCDDQAPPRTAGDWFMRRVYTWEAEFYHLSQSEALTRLYAGSELFERLGWPLEGFVAPAWLMSDGTRQALRQLPLSYTSDARHLYRLPDFASVHTPGLVFSAGSALRRGLSRAVCGLQEQYWQNAPVLRLGLHPVDMRHEFSRNYWLRTLEQMLESGREPMTKANWLGSVDVS